MVWCSRVGDNLDTATGTVAKNRQEVPLLPASQGIPHRAFISISKTLRAHTGSHQPPGREDTEPSVRSPGFVGGGVRGKAGGGQPYFLTMCS